MMLLIMMVVGEDLRGPSYKYGLNDVAEMVFVLGLFLVLGAPIAYAITVAFGVPLYLITNRLGLINFWSVTFGAAFAAVLPILLASAHRGFVVYSDSGKSSLWFYLAFTLCGFVVGSVFWFVSGLYKQAAHNNQLNKDAPKSGAPVS